MTEDRNQTGTFTGKISLVTGAASGLGRALAWALARAGSDLVAVDVNDAGLKETASIIEQERRQCLVKKADVSDRKAMETLAAEVLAEWGRVDILVNNAGVGVGGELRNIPLEDIEWVVRTNLLGEIYGTRLFLPQMIERRAGHVVNIASLSALVALPYHIAYTAPKFGLAGFSQALWAEARRYGVGVTLVCPAMVKTGIARSSRNHPQTEGQKAAEIAWRERLEKKGMEPTEAARRILKAVERKRFLVLIGWETHLLYHLNRLFPGLTLRLMEKASVQWYGPAGITK